MGRPEYYNSELDIEASTLVSVRENRLHLELRGQYNNLVETTYHLSLRSLYETVT